MGKHSVVGIVMPICATVSFILTATFNSLSAQDTDLGIYTQSTTNVSRKFDLAVTPAGWAFSIWGLIYFWQAALLLYSITLIFRKAPHSSSGNALYIDPGVVPISFFAVYVINMGFNIGWTLIFDREYINVALGFIAGIALTLYIIMFVALRQLNNCGAALEREGAHKEIWFHRVIIQNGIAIYAAWVTVATMINLAMVIQYTGGASRSTAAWIVLGILMGIVNLYYSILDNWFFERHLRYVFAPYVVLIWANAAVLSRNYDSDRNTSNMVIALLALSCFYLVLKIVLTVYRAVRCPIVYENSGSVTTGGREEKMAM